MPETGVSYLSGVGHLSGYYGHALFEMAAGYEMSTTKPTDKNYADVEHAPEVYQVLQFIFENDNNNYPTLEEVASLDFFRNIDLRELTTHTVPPILKTTLSSTAQHLLRDVQKFYRNKGKVKTSRSISQSSCDGGESSDSEKAGLLPRGVRSKRRAGSSTQGTLTLKKPRPPLSSELLLPPAGCGSSSPPPEFSSSPPQADTPHADTPPPEATPMEIETTATISTSPPSKASETPPPEPPPRPAANAALTWIHSQSSVSTCGSVEYCTPPSSPQADEERYLSDCVA